MDAGEWIALGSMVVALGAGTFAALAWYQARRSADAAHRSADAAERSADAEERAANVAELAEADLRAPRLEFHSKGRAGQEAHVAVILIGGPPEVVMRGIDVWIKDAPEPGKRTTLGAEGGTTRVAINGSHAIPIDLRSRRDALTIELTVECTDPEAHPSRSWTRTGTVHFQAALPQPITAQSDPVDAPPRGLFREDSF